MPERRHCSMRPPTTVGIVAALLLSVGCSAHVALPGPPPPHAPPETLAEYCDDMRPRAMRRNASSSVAMELGNGMVVRDAGDLLPVVGEETTAGKAARAAASAEATSDTSTIAAVVTFAAGAALLVVPSLPNDLLPLEQSVRESLYAAGVISLAATLIPLGILVVAGTNAGSLRDDAFRAYEQHFYDERPPCDRSRARE